MITVYFKQHHPDAVAPAAATIEAAGLDLVSVEEVTLAPGQFQAVDTGVAMELPPGYEGQIRPRSGLAAKKGITVLNAPGTIDSDYRGTIKVILINHSAVPYMVCKGDRIAQLVIAKLTMYTIDNVSSLSDTNRGSNGFGSTGR